MTHITVHARDRAHERIGVKKHSTDRLFEIAKQKGRRHDVIKGRFRRYLDGLLIKHHASDIYIYGQFMYACKEDFLITILLIPKPFQ